MSLPRGARRPVTVDERTHLARRGRCFGRRDRTTTQRLGAANLADSFHLLRRHRVVFPPLAFLKLLMRQHRGRELHVIIDNSSAHGTPAVRQWLEKHPNVHFHYTPTSAPWLDQVEAIFSILTRRSLRHGDFRTKTSLRKHIEAFLNSRNKNPTPFVWTKQPHALVRDHRRMLARISYAAH